MKRGKFEAAKPSRKPTAAQKHTGGASAPKQSGGGKKVGIILGCVILVAVLCVCAFQAAISKFHSFSLITVLS